MTVPSDRGSHRAPRPRRRRNRATPPPARYMGRFGPGRPHVEIDLTDDADPDDDVDLDIEPDIPLEVEYPDLWPSGDDLDAIEEAETMGVEGW